MSLTPAVLAEYDQVRDSEDFADGDVDVTDLLDRMAATLRAELGDEPNPSDPPAPEDDALDLIADAVRDWRRGEAPDAADVLELVANVLARTGRPAND